MVLYWTKQVVQLKSQVKIEGLPESDGLENFPGVISRELGIVLNKRHLTRQNTTPPGVY